MKEFVLLRNENVNMRYFDWAFCFVVIRENKM